MSEGTWKKYRHRSDPSVVYTAVDAGDGTYRARGPAWLNLGSGAEMRIPKGFFEDFYEEVGEADDQAQG